MTQGDASPGKRPVTPVLLGGFFVFATTMCLIAGLSLLTPSGPLDWIWRVKPAEHRELLQFGPIVGIGFLGLALVMAAASIGSFTRRRWGWRLALLVFVANAAGDAARMPFGAVWQGLLGVAVTGAIVWRLTRVRADFDR
jgi:hypothetical protein